jgi:soluble lytic murein transglycosylase
MAVACVDGAPNQDSQRLDLLERGMTLRAVDPKGAVELFARAGVGTELERVRLRLWLAGLERSGASSDEWRRLLALEPPRDLEVGGRLGLADALMGEGRVSEAVAVLEDAPDGMRGEADERLLAMGPGPWLEPAARRLGVSSPRRLRRANLDLERRLLPTLSPLEWLERSAAWRRAGLPKTAAGELRRLRWRGDEELLRRLELARSEIAAGSPSRALQLISTGSPADTERLLIRGEAFRRRGWNRIPDPNAASAFGSCLEAARQAVAASTDDDQRQEALRLILECGTETGALEEAVEAWWGLLGLGWSDERREWLGRRLGVAVARRGTDLDVVADLASSLPNHNRCLRFWSALAMSDGGRGELQSLAAVDVSDIYGRWARQLLGLAEPAGLRLASSLDPAPPSATVRWLLDRDEERLAAQEWADIVAVRGSLPAEAVAAAELAGRLDRPHAVVRWVLRGFPRLGTVDLADTPENVIRAYLPLRWERSLRAAADESGLDPWLLAGVARQESLFTSHARSPRGAIGVLQLIPETARGHARALGISGTPDLYDPAINIRIGARELARLIRRFGALEPALSAYNAGETRTRRWWRRWPDRHRFTESVPIPETYNYIRGVTYLADAYRLVYADVWRGPP